MNRRQSTKRPVDELPLEPGAIQAAVERGVRDAQANSWRRPPRGFSGPLTVKVAGEASNLTPRKVAPTAQLVIVGSLGRDPQSFGNGDDSTKVTRLSIATNRVWKDGDGNRQQATDWHPVVAFGPLAELAAKLEKGDPVAIGCRGQTRRFEQDGETVYAYEIVARVITPPSRLGRQPRSGGEPGDAAGAGAS